MGTLLAQDDRSPTVPVIGQYALFISRPTYPVSMFDHVLATHQCVKAVRQFEFWQINCLDDLLHVSVMRFASAFYPCHPFLCTHSPLGCVLKSFSTASIFFMGS